MRGYKHVAWALLALLPVLVIIGCGGDDDDDNGLQNTRIAFQSGSADAATIFTMNGDGSSQQQILADGMDPAISRDGQRIAFADGPEIFVANVDGSGVTQLTNNGAGFEADDPEFSPDGSQIAYNLKSTAPGGLSTIRLMNADGANDIELVSPGTDATFTPDGDTIAYSNLGNIFQISAQGGMPTQLTDHPIGSLADDATYDPFGKQIAFTFRDTPAGQPSIRSLNTVTDQETTLVTDAAEPAFDPSGNNIAFTRNGMIFSQNLATTAQTQLTAGPAHTQPSWSSR